MVLRSLVLLVALVFVPVSSASAQSGDGAGAYSPSFAKDTRVFELRTYYAAPGKLEALNARFRDHTNALFQKHGMTLVGYWMPVAPPAEGAGGTLVYVLAFPSAEAREASWKGFREDPAWIKARDASEKDGKLVAKIDSVVMKATDYSPMK
jgi:hypothetical protein